MASKRWVYVQCSFAESLLSDQDYLDYFLQNLPQKHTVQLVEVKRMTTITEATVRIYTKLSFEEIDNPRFGGVEIWEIDALELLSKALK